MAQLFFYGYHYLLEPHMHAHTYAHTHITPHSMQIHTTPHLHASPKHLTHTPHLHTSPIHLTYTPHLHTSPTHLTSYTPHLHPPPSPHNPVSNGVCVALATGSRVARQRPGSGCGPRCIHSHRPPQCTGECGPGQKRISAQGEKFKGTHHLGRGQHLGSMYPTV